MLTSLVDGCESNRVSIYDRGLAYGDGCFTTALIVNGAIELFEQHLERLDMHSAKLGLPAVDISELSANMQVAAKELKLGIIKVILTAGSGGRGYSRQGINKTQTIISVHDYPMHYGRWQKQGIKVGVSQQHLGNSPMLAGLKHLNRLEQVLIRAELDKLDDDELLVTDINGYVVECSCANVFWYKSGQWFTPEILAAGVAGLMRAKILSGKLNINQGNFTLSELENIDAMFITNAILGIVPVKKFNENNLDILIVKDIQKQFNIKLG